MSTTNEQIVTNFARSCLTGISPKFWPASPTTSSIYQNMPWKPMMGHAGMRKVLAPFLHGAPRP